MKTLFGDKKQLRDKKQTAKGSIAASSVAPIDERTEEKIDRDLRDSFPASDPPGWTLGIEHRRVK